MTLRIANGAGFLGDSLDAPRRLVESAEVDYLTIEHLAELTLSILAYQRSKDPNAGYATDFLDIIESLCPSLASQSQLHIVANSGGMNPEGCARAVGKLLVQHGFGDLQLGVVTGDDLLHEIDGLRKQGCEFRNLDTGQPLSELTEPVVSANAYLGAKPIADALQRDARIVITGRVADASLTVGPTMHRFGWSWTDWDKLAAASVAGHLIECGAQVTGAYSNRWREMRLADVGYPIAEIESDGQTVITKPAGTGGVVDRRSVIEQLIYEIGDPRHYLTPDVDVDFTSVEVADLGNDRVRVTGACGAAAPRNYKVSLAYRAGYTSSGQLLVYGEDAVEKAQACGEMILERLAKAGWRPAHANIELLGAGAAVPRQPDVAQSSNAEEVMLRVTVRDPRREAVERFTKEFAPLITSGPSGLAGYATARSPVRPVMAYWPTLVPRELVTACVRVQSANAWLG
ncbi:MAG: hypothetical protein RIS70_2615 [Planctomycetota bacterium]